MNKRRPRRIQIFLPDGNARGVKIAQITTRTVEAIHIPRNKIKKVANRDEVNKPGIYFLFGKKEENAKNLVYIGKAESIVKRLIRHNRKKDFWNIAIAVTSKTNQFTQTQITYLEWYCIEQSKKLGRYEVGNINTPKEPHTSEAEKADLEDNFDTIRVLLSTLGSPVLDEIRNTSTSKADSINPNIDEIANEDYTYILDRHHIKAKGQYTEDGFIVFKGSEAMKEFKISAPDYVKKIRVQLINDGLLTEKQNKYVFTEDYIFSSPSGASSLITGVSSSGWRAWKEEYSGKTLNEIIREN